MHRILPIVLLMISTSSSIADTTCSDKSRKVAAKMAINTGSTADIVDTAVQAGSFKTLAAALNAAGLVETLKNTDNLTVFAPTDEAFAKLPEGTIESLLEPSNREKLQRILTYHVVPARVPFKVAAGLDEATALSEDTIEINIKKGALYLNEARVIDNDIEASNGIIHVIDTVLIPEFEDTASRSPALRIINSAIDKGVPLFNHGQHGACADLYELAAEAVLEMSDEMLNDSAREQLADKLSRATRQSSDTRRAWMLRYALNDVIDHIN